MPPNQPSALDVTLAYHERTKHHPFRYAASLGYMDWATQPDPFRRYAGAPLLPLDLIEPGPEPPYGATSAPGRVSAAPVTRESVSRLFHDSLAISAWKEAGSSRWALRVNPSSGNLHPTEGYLIAGAVSALSDRPAVFHYTALEHALERRAELSDACWNELAAQLPGGSVLVALTSIYWRESWKYGERAFRYCHHDVGHAIGSVAIAAAGLGWSARLLEGVTDQDLRLLLGVASQTGIEAEHPDCLLAVFPCAGPFSIDEQRRFTLTAAVRDELARARWLGSPNRLSADHHRWPVIDDVSTASERHVPPDPGFWAAAPADQPVPEAPTARASLRAIVHQRRSAVALDGQTDLDSTAFYEILDAVMPARREVPLAALSWRPCVDLLLFVHRVRDVRPGLYVLLRDASRETALRETMTRPHVWERPDGCPASLPLFLLEAGDARWVARQTSCDQEIAADGVFAVAMLAEYRTTLESFGAWHYRRLFWETGAIGQVLYLEAEVHGIRGTGIGCFFDDLTHHLFGIEGDRFQVLYHFTMGGAVEDRRLQTLPPYQHLSRVREVPGAGGTPRI